MAESRLASLFFAQIGEEHLVCGVEGNIDAGEPEIIVPWGPVGVPISLVKYISRAYNFNKKFGIKSITSFIEIGPGLGFSTIAHRLLNRNINLFVNVDIPSTLYISSQYLKATGLFNCIDYRDLPKGRILLKDLEGSSNNPTLICVPPWRAEDLPGSISWSHNAFSFQEMEANVVEAYAEVLGRCVCDGH